MGSIIKRKRKDFAQPRALEALPVVDTRLRDETLDVKERV
jgi:hypothetical protein